MFGLIFVPHSLPHVITVCLKTTAQIEVVVSNRVKALEESEELRQNYFEVVEAMAMHLMWEFTKKGVQKVNIACFALSYCYRVHAQENTTKPKWTLFIQPLYFSPKKGKSVSNSNPTPP